MEPQTVPWYRSPVLIGQVVAAASVGAGLFTGTKIDGAMQADLSQMLIWIGNAAGIAITVIGRITSKVQPVTLTK